MNDDRHTPKGIAVPQNRLARLTRLGGLAAGVAGSVAVNGGRQMLAGRAPHLGELVLTPSNLARITTQLAQMRGAAMKIGQVMSMDGGTFLPPELADILARLRADAHFMPPRQLKQVLVRNFGTDFLRRFDRFDVRPIAAASIGQVHRATLKSGAELAIKIQYPGIRSSIDSDVSNVATLLRMSGLIPSSVDLAPLLAAARAQLHEEADYEREGQMLLSFGALLRADSRFTVPTLFPDLTTPDILAMSYQVGKSVDQLETAPQGLRDRVVTDLVMLMLQEVFGFHLMQTDPNFANYSYDAATDRIVLLDFGASQPITPQMATLYRGLLAAGLAQDQGAIVARLEQIGILTPQTSAAHVKMVLDLFTLATMPLRAGGVFDFATTDLPQQLRDAGLEIALGQDFWVIPPTETLLLQRKIGGLFLLAIRLGARVDMDAVLAAIPPQPRQPESSAPP